MMAGRGCGNEANGANEANETQGGILGVDADFGKDNKIFTREKAEAAMKRMRERLRRMEEEEKEKSEERRGAEEDRQG